MLLLVVQLENLRNFKTAAFHPDLLVKLVSNKLPLKQTGCDPIYHVQTPYPCDAPEIFHQCQHRFLHESFISTNKYARVLQYPKSKIYSL